MDGILQLEKFVTRKLSAEFVIPELKTDASPVMLKHSFGIDYQVGRREDDELRYRLTLQVSLKAETAGWNIEGVLDGYFLCPTEMPVPVREGAVRVNGGTILYGILRGQLSALTGTFPEHPFVLPTVNMLQIVEEKEKALGSTIIEATAEEPDKSP
jgi:hypothetical protein